MYIDVLLYFEVLLTELAVDWPLTGYSNVLILKLDNLKLPSVLRVNFVLKLLWFGFKLIPTLRVVLKLVSKVQDDSQCELTSFSTNDVH